MKAIEFRKLPPKRQRRIVVEAGVPLARRESRNFSIYLYALEGFYVEVYFFRENGEYGSLKPFDDVDGLTPYLQQIDIQGVLPQ